MDKTLKEQFEAFKNDLKEFFNASPSKFLDFKLADGTIVRCDTEALAKGSKLDVIDEKGNVLPLPDGDYDFNGQKFSVEAGYVKELMAGDMPPAAEGDKPDEGGDMAQMMDMLKSLEARIAALEGGGAPAEEMKADVAKANEAVANTITRLEKTEKELSESKEAFKKLFEMTEQIVNQTPEPKAKPVNFEKQRREPVMSEVEEFRKKYLTK